MSNPRILVIDDDPMFRSLVVSLLRKDYLVSVAGDGAEGFQKAREFTPDLMIVDVQMPGWDGIKTLSAMRGHPPLARVPVMMLTGDASRQTVVAAIKAGANDYIIKTGFSRLEFLEKIKRLLANVINESVEYQDIVAARAARNSLCASAAEPVSQTRALVDVKTVPTAPEPKLDDDITKMLMDQWD